jgi:hypothetical protein
VSRGRRPLSGHRHLLRKCQKSRKSLRILTAKSKKGEVEKTNLFDLFDFAVHFSPKIRCLLRFRVEYPAACGVLFFANKVGGVRDTETESFLSEHNTPLLAAGYFMR